MSKTSYQTLMNAMQSILNSMYAMIMAMTIYFTLSFFSMLEIYFVSKCCCVFGFWTIKLYKNYHTVITDAAIGKNDSFA